MRLLACRIAELTEPVDRIQCMIDLTRRISQGLEKESWLEKQRRAFFGIYLDARSNGIHALEPSAASFLAVYATLYEDERWALISAIDAACVWAELREGKRGDPNHGRSTMAVEIRKVFRSHTQGRV